MLPSFDVVKGEGPSLEVKLCLCFPVSLETFRFCMASLTEAIGRFGFNVLVFSISSASSWMTNCVDRRLRVGGDPLEACVDIMTLEFGLQR